MVSASNQLRRENENAWKTAKFILNWVCPGQVAHTYSLVLLFMCARWCFLSWKLDGLNTFMVSVYFILNLLLVLSLLLGTLYVVIH